MSNALSKAKDFQKSKSGTYVSIATTAFGAWGIAKRIRKARAD